MKITNKQKRKIDINKILRITLIIPLFLAIYFLIFKSRILLYIFLIVIGIILFAILFLLFSPVIFGLGIFILVYGIFVKSLSFITFGIISMLISGFLLKFLLSHSNEKKTSIK